MISLLYRHHYYATRSKVIIRNKDRDASFIIDAAGGSGVTHHPHPAASEKNEPGRATLLKTKCTFCKIHFWGTIIFMSYPDLEPQGANLTIECMYRTILYIYQQRRARGNNSRLRNIYVQLDNASPNKNWALMAAAAYLVMLGLCRKVKYSFLLVGHTHDDIDAIIGTVVTYLRSLDSWSFAEFVEACKTAVKSGSALSRVVDVQRLVGITDYVAIFADVSASFDIKGITCISEARITAAADGSISLLYKDDVTVTGWMPRPVPLAYCPHIWNRVFAHPGLGQGNVTRLDSVANVEKGRRQSYHYTVKYAGGDSREVDLDCPSLPQKITREMAIDRIRMLPHQRFDVNWFKGKSAEVLSSIKSLLVKRGQETHCAEWDYLILKTFPQSADEDINGHESPLVLLYREYGGEIQRKTDRYVAPKGVTFYVVQ